MRTKTTPIADRLDPYGRPDCLICGQPKEMSYRDDVSSESVFAGERFQLTCRNHPGHPLHSNVRVTGGGLYRDDQGRLIREGKTYSDGFVYMTEPDEVVSQVDVTGLIK